MVSMNAESHLVAVHESKRSKIKRVYAAVNEVAAPGDVVFFITQRPVDRSRPALERLARLAHRNLQGFSIHDNSDWHTSMYTHARKERGGSGIRPYVIHSADGDGTEQIFIPPAYFAIKRNDVGEIVSYGRIEILKNPDLTERERETLVAYARDQLGKPHAVLGWKQDLPTYLLGVRARKIDSHTASCHGIVYAAYGKIGIGFPHQLKKAPFFNPARYIGHPVGGSPINNNPERLYLHDHHLYRDCRFHSVLAVTQDASSEEMKLLVFEKPGKYSWDPRLRTIYGIEGNP
jgi:hypothetical protein